MKQQIVEFFSDGNWLNLMVPFLINVLVALAILIVGGWIATHFTRLLDKVMQIRHIDEALRSFLLAIVSTLFKFIIALVAIEQLGVDTTSLLAILGAAGLAVALALKDSLSNFASGVMLILFKPFKVGDFVEAGGTSGICEKITVFNTIFKSLDNKEIIVPNTQISSGTIVNYSAKPTRRIDLVIGIGYDDDIKKARDLLQQILDSDDRVLKDPAPVIAVDQLGESSVDIIVRPWVLTSNYGAVRWHLLEEIKTTFDANGVTIPYPQRDVHMLQPAQSNG